MLVFLGFINMLKICGGMKSPHKTCDFAGNPDNPPTIFFDLPGSHRKHRFRWVGLPALRRRFITAFGG